ncbi:proteasome-type protease [Croceicoccus sp. YJ47]|uniref:proteasome-type protease n=1 Tax=Croceicoccus sp. YJ47 TaxID=2798724 RepID=UPI001924E47B|nr:proteasome-type protease [Croceicoccus sp. YJ47]QQN74426.1 proteasome-type protease [Croceicoccus sp. YJ47]
MTYCVGMLLDKGIVMMSDTRTNSGVDNISVFRKMTTFQGEDRVITMMTAGNLATTQAVISQLEERNKTPEEREPTIFKAPTMFQVANMVGDLLRDVVIQRQMSNKGQSGGPKFTASIIVAGQIEGMEPRLFMIYPEGNFIEASTDTPFFQIGETKYGRPIILRGYDWNMSFEDAVKLLMVSMDSTLAANLSVGMPLDVTVLERDLFEPKHERRIMADDPYFNAISSGWGEALRSAFHSLPDYSFYNDDSQS